MNSTRQGRRDLAPRTLRRYPLGDSARAEKPTRMSVSQAGNRRTQGAELIAWAVVKDDNLHRRPKRAPVTLPAACGLRPWHKKNPAHWRAPGSRIIFRHPLYTFQVVLYTIFLLSREKPVPAKDPVFRNVAVEKRESGIFGRTRAYIISAAGSRTGSRRRRRCRISWRRRCRR